jgi:hypothetical protein
LLLPKSNVSGREGDVSVNSPVPWIPIDDPSHPGPNNTFMPRKKAIATARTYVKTFIPSSYTERIERE